MALNFRKTLERLAAGDHIDKSVPEVVDAIMPQQDTAIKLTPAQSVIKGINESIVPEQGVPNNPAFGVPQGVAKLPVDTSIAPSFSPNRVDAMNEDVMNTPVQPTGLAMNMIPGDAPPRMISYRDDAKEKLQQALHAPVKQHSKLGDFAAYAISGLNAALNPNPNNKVQGLGAFEHDRNIRSAAQKYGQLEDINQNERQDVLKESQIGNQQNEAYIRTQNAITQRRKVEADIDKERKADELKGKLWTPRTNPDDGTITKHFGDGHEEPLLDDKGKQRIDILRAPVFDADGNPMTGAQRGNQQAMRDAGNATRQQQVDIHNADKAFEVQKQNVSNQMDYNKNVLSVVEKIATANQGVVAANPQLAGLAGTQQQYAENMAELANALNTEVDPARQQDLQKRFDIAQKEFNKVNNDYLSALGKVEGGKSIAAELQKQLKSIVKPKILTYTPVKASKVGGKTIPRSKDPQGLYQ